MRESGVRESGVRARTDTDALVDVQRLELNRVNEELRQRARACVIEVERRHAAYFAHNPAPLIEITRAPLMAMAEALSANGDPQVAARRAMSALAVSAANEAALDALGVASIDALDLGDAPCLTFSSDELIEAVWALKAGRAVAVNAHMALRDAEARQVRLRVRPVGRLQDAAAPATLVCVLELVGQSGETSADQAPAGGAGLDDPRLALRLLASAVAGASLPADPEFNAHRVIAGHAEVLASVLRGASPRLRATSGAELAEEIQTAVAACAPAHLDIAVVSESLRVTLDVERVVELVARAAQSVAFQDSQDVRLDITLRGQDTQFFIALDAWNAELVEREPLARLTDAALAGLVGASWTVDDASAGHLRLIMGLELTEPCLPLIAPKSTDLIDETGTGADEGADEGADAPALASTRPHVLIAEDNPVNQRVMQAMLDVLGLRTQVAEDGLAAVTAAQGPFDLILMDVCMPGIDGVEATRRIRAGGGPNAATPVLAVTANAMPGDRQSLLAAGMNDILPKPVDGAVLAQAIARWLRDRPAGQTDELRA